MNELKRLMYKHNLSTSDIARMLGRKKNTVEIWLSRDTMRPIPENNLKLLRLLLDPQK